MYWYFILFLIYTLCGCNSIKKNQVFGDGLKYPKMVFIQSINDSILKRDFVKITRVINPGGNGIAKSVKYRTDSWVSIGISELWYANGNRESVGVWDYLLGDTLILNDSLVVFRNPYPDVYLETICSDCETNLNQLNLVYVSGYTISWYKDGSLRGACVDNDSLGTKKNNYYKNGKIRSVGHYQNNKENNKWRYFDEQGVLIDEIIYPPQHLAK
ncbi:MAG: antitoxin component YwqK of YwqJK toxin-antitoxin module [Salibacteraceae bacterium]|jgi:antitoxin component YwqK of YwqJK toxin-antitoxin module